MIHAGHFTIHESALLFPLPRTPRPKLLTNPTADEVVVASVQLRQHGASSLIEPLLGFAAVALRVALDAVAELTLEWSDSVFLERLLEGTNVASVRRAREADVLETARTIETQLLDLLPDSDLFDAGARVPARTTHAVLALQARDGYAAPTGGLTIKFMNHPIGAMHVIEGFAQSLESGGSFQRVARSKRPQDYLSLWTHSVVAYGIKRVDDSIAFNRMHKTFAALCDLALFVPIGATYGRLRAKTATWLDLQPGSRFLEALDVVAKDDLWIPDIPGELKDLHNRICARLNWRPPDDFLSLGASLRHRQFHRLRDACQVRIDRYDTFLEFHDSADIRPFFRNHFPIMRLPSQEHTVVDRKRGADLITGYFLANILWRLMLERHISRGSLLPRGVSYPSLFSNIRNERDMHAFIIEGLPRLDLVRFGRLQDVLARTVHARPRKAAAGSSAS